ncbi:D-lyxose ketol-isomerase [Planctomycetes bacterium CA13]|uniref:D-lyxose ketol-isomerase n=1 Tax=Novipirellula herctigrandis TaxID=2527986 RepID=A0A5C5Z0H8_9BACT|nr:D-lyxose ketol-isomerase [Planctomycetes bacterium CA13]
MKRRTLMKATALAAAAPLALNMKVADAAPMRNADFYTDSKFDEEKAKDGLMAMCKRFGYPLFPEFREKLWVSDYGTGNYAKLGLAALMYENHNSEDGAYMLMDLFLLPGQMLPEHWHLEGDLGIIKNEGWLVRWGKSYIGGIGDNNVAEFPEIEIPKVHCNGTTTTHHVVAATQGMFVPLAELRSRHWQFGGPEGAIITEVANLHTDSAVRHSDKAINDNFLGL